MQDDSSDKLVKSSDASGMETDHTEQSDALLNKYTKVLNENEDT